MEEFVKSWNSTTPANDNNSTQCLMINAYNLSRTALIESISEPRLLERNILEVIWIIIAISGFVLNTAQIFWILSHPRKSVMDVFIVSLSIIDLQTCCLTIPFQVTELFYNFDWAVFGTQALLACQFRWYFKHSSVVSGSVMISLIAVSRYLAISNPMKVKKNRICINTALAMLTWVGTVTLVAPLASATVTIHHIPHYTYNKNESLLCRKEVLRCEHVTPSLTPIFYGSMLFFVVPVAIMCVSYSSLIRILIKRKHSDLTYKGHNKHFTKSIVNSILGLTYILLVAPKGIYDMIQTKRYIEGGESTEDDKFIELILYVVATTVVISNPIIYTFLTSRFLRFVEKHSHSSNHASHGSQHSICSKAESERRHTISLPHSRPCLSRKELLDKAKLCKHEYPRQDTEKTIIMLNDEPIEVEVYTCEELDALAEQKDDYGNDKKICEDTESVDNMYPENITNKYRTL